MSYSSKYNDTIYYLAPFYHKIFPELERLVVLDVDTKFQSDPADLFDEFGLFSDTNLIGCGLELTPHYYQMLENAGYYDLNPATGIGRPGKQQGLNVGVLLLELKRIRESYTYEYFLSDDGISYLTDKYGLVNSTLGEQDWLNLVTFEDPGLVHVLPCWFNYQLSQEYNVQPWISIFDMYHLCRTGRSILSEKDAKIVHGNSDAWF